MLEMYGINESRQDVMADGNQYCGGRGTATTSGGNAWRRGGCSNAAFGSCKYGRAMTTGFRGETGTRTKISSVITDRWPWAWREAPPR